MINPTFTVLIGQKNDKIDTTQI